MRLPEMTPLQYAVLSLLFSGERTGAELRRALGRRGSPCSAAAFSKLMRRMGFAGYVDAERTPRHAAAHPTRECRYRVTDLGVILWNATREFYRSFAPPGPDLKPVESDEAKFADHPLRERKALLKKAIAEKMELVVMGLLREQMRSSRQAGG